MGKKCPQQNSPPHLSHSKDKRKSNHQENNVEYQTVARNTADVRQATVQNILVQSELCPLDFLTPQQILIMEVYKNLKNICLQLEILPRDYITRDKTSALSL